MLAFIKYKNSDYSTALRLVYEAISIRKDIDEFHAVKALILSRINDRSEAQTTEMFGSLIRLDSCYNLGGKCMMMIANAHIQLNNRAQAIKWLLSAENLLENDENLLLGLACQLRLSGDLAGSMSRYNRVLALDPLNVKATFWRDVLLNQDLKSIPHELTTKLFDSYACNFNDHLIQSLGYVTPALIADSVSKYDNSQQFDICLDLGCGTGLFPNYYRNCKEYHGVDLSANMLSEARKLNVYSLLANQDISTFLASSSRYDQCLVVMCDVLGYIGDVDEVFRLIADKCRGSLVCFSVEALVDDTSDFKMQMSGRFAHSSEYIRRVLSQNRISVKSESYHLLRHNCNGFVFISMTDC